jgi:hypothetical protein
VTLAEDLKVRIEESVENYAKAQKAKIPAMPFTPHANYNDGKNENNGSEKEGSEKEGSEKEDSAFA